MKFLVEHAVVWFLVVVSLLYFASRAGEFFHKRGSGRFAVDDKEFDLVVGATLPLRATA